ncbi:hypothetical protein ACO22_01924 [Paracoccidioides brasiliensis]|uniref:ER-bound oxygenase mpaB/mpaB'/Rubber oxygenase catalytic domain-containing protein n=1 Tax=Paracoccidioides brasiliensis TaxID=121759 RepID=A0A1D2JK55_PARBR|nr:hypothetical protein ACO22_01924 [Paracoccidioides brasiliensis]
MHHIDQIIFGWRGCLHVFQFFKFWAGFFFRFSLHLNNFTVKTRPKYVLESQATVQQVVVQANGVKRQPASGKQPSETTKPATMTSQYFNPEYEPKEIQKKDLFRKASYWLGGACQQPNNLELQIWVAATLYVTEVGTYEKIFGPLDDRTAEKLSQEYSVFATALHVLPGKWPADRCAFRKYWDEMIDTIEITYHAAPAAKILFVAKAGTALDQGQYAHSAFVDSRMAATTAPGGIRAEYVQVKVEDLQVFYTYCKGDIPHLPLFV